MSSACSLDALRARNRDLLKQLEQQREEVERVLGRKRDREDGSEERGQTAEAVTRTDGHRCPPRPAVAKPTVRFADTCENQAGLQHGVTSQLMESSDLLKHSGRHLGVQRKFLDSRPYSSKSCLKKTNEEHIEEQNQITDPSDKCEDIPTSNRRHLQPLLGYDWIAGVLDAEETFIEHSDEFFNDLHIFRSLHKDECVQNPNTEFTEDIHPGLLTDKDDPEAKTDTHHCTFSYRINSRLFPVPVHGQECCPVCKKLKSSHPHTAAEPALIRVSLPRSTLLPPYKYKAHRRCSFDPSDSLGLPSHCLSGWSHTGQSTLPPPSSLDLRSSLNTKNSALVQSQKLEDLSIPKAPADQISDHMLNVSKLARHKFEHFSPKKSRERILPTVLTNQVFF